MAATYTLSGNPKTLLGSEDFERVRAYIKCDQPLLTDPDTGEVRIIGEADLILAGATSTEFEVELPGNGWTPSPHFYTIYVEGRSRTTGTNRVVTTSPFEMTADMTLADLPQAAPQAITVTDYESLIAARDEAVDSAAVAEAAAAEATAIVTADLDGANAVLIENPASDTAAALSASIDAAVLGLIEVEPPPLFSFVRTAMPTVYRAPNGRYVVDLNVDTLKPAAGVTYYVSPAGVTGNNGLTEAAPTTPLAAYNKSDVGTIVFLAGEYFQNLSWFGKIAKSLRVILRPGAIVTSFRNPSTLTWALHAGNIYKANRTNTNLVLDKRAAYAVVSPDSRIDGDGKVYEKVANVAAIVKAGQWAYDTAVDATNPSFVWPLGNADLTADSSFMRLNVDTGNAIFNVWGGVTLYIKSEGGWFEGGGQAGHGIVAAMTNGGTGGIPTLINEDVVCKYAPANGLTAVGAGLVINIRSGVAHTYLDGFNYHSGTYLGDNIVPDVIEIDCWSRDTGLYTTTETMNGSTTHDNIRILRINPDHAESFGPVVAEDSGGRSWNLGGSSKRSSAVTRKWCFAATAAGSVQWIEGTDVDELGRAALYADGTSSIHTRGIRAGSMLGASKNNAGTGVIDTF